MGACVPLSPSKILMVVLHSVMSASVAVTVAMMTVNHSLTINLRTSLSAHAQTVQPLFSTDGHTLFLAIGLLVPVITGMVATFYPHPRSRVVHGVFLAVALVTDMVLFGLETTNLHLMSQCPCSLQEDGCVCGCQDPPPSSHVTTMGYDYVDLKLCYAARTRVVYVVFLTLGWLAVLSSLGVLVAPPLRACLSSSTVVQRIKKKGVRPGHPDRRIAPMTPSVPPVSHSRP